MDNKTLQKYAEQHGGVEIAAVQAELGVPYGEIRQAVEKMVEDGKLVYDSGLRYKFKKPLVVEPVAEEGWNKPTRRARADRGALENFLKWQSYDPNKDVGKSKLAPSTKENRLKALECCMFHGEASVSLLQRNLPLSYVKARNIIDWMKSEGYISPFDDGAIGKYKINLTWHEYVEKFGPPSGEFGDGSYDTPPLTEEKKSEDEAVPPVKEALPTKTESVGNLAAVLNQIKLKKQQPITADVCPCRSLWPDEAVLKNLVWERINELARSDPEMVRWQAIATAETYLHAVRDTHDGKMMQLYERMVYELKRMGDFEYLVRRKRAGN